MKYQNKFEGGFVGILVLLISVAVMAYLMVQNMESLKIGTPATSTKISGEKGSGGGLAPINAATNAKLLIEKDNQRAIQELD